MTTLDSSGFVEVPARIRPPRVSDKAFDGQIVVRAFLTVHDIICTVRAAW